MLLNPLVIVEKWYKQDKVLRYPGYDFHQKDHTPINFSIPPNNSVLKCWRDNENLPSFIQAFKTLVLILLHIEIGRALNDFMRSQHCRFIYYILFLTFPS